MLFSSLHRPRGSQIRSAPPRFPTHSSWHFRIKVIHTKTPITAFHFQHFWMVTANDPGRSNTNGQHSATEHDQKVQKPAGFNLNLPGSFFSRACKTWKKKRDTSWLVVSRFFFSVLWALAKSDLGRSKWNPAGSWTFWSCSVALCGPFVLDRPQSFAVAIQKCWKPEAVMEGFPVIRQIWAKLLEFDRQWSVWPMAAQPTSALRLPSGRGGDSEEMKRD